MTLNKAKHTTRSSGYIAITTLLIVSAVSLSIALTVSLTAIGQSQMSLSNKRGQEALYLAESCVEDALYQINDNNSYTGGTLNILNGSCTINVTTSGNNWTIHVEATKDSYSKSIQAEATRTGNVAVNSWQEQ